MVKACILSYILTKRQEKQSLIQFLTKVFTKVIKKQFEKEKTFTGKIFQLILLAGNIKSKREVVNHK